LSIAKRDLGCVGLPATPPATEKDSQDPKRKDQHAIDEVQEAASPTYFNS